MVTILENWLSDPTARTLLTALLSLLVIYLLMQYVRRSIGRYVTDSGTRYLARKIVSLVGYFLAAGVLATLFSDRLAGLTVAFGLAGAGVAFALQEVIASIAGWVSISFGGSYHTGDRIELGGVRGDVIDISILRTTLMELGNWVNGDLYSGRIVRVSNSVVFKEPVFNYSADFPFLWDELRFPVRYGSDWRMAREMFQRITGEVTGQFASGSASEWKAVVRKYKIEDARIQPMVAMEADENWMTFTLRYIVDYKLRRKVKNSLFTRILEEIEASRGQVRIASTSMELTSSPSLDLRILEGQTP